MIQLVAKSNLPILESVSNLKGPFTEAIFVAQLNAIFVALKLQPAAISSRF